MPRAHIEKAAPIYLFSQGLLYLLFGVYIILLAYSSSSVDDKADGGDRIPDVIELADDIVRPVQQPPAPVRV